MAGQLWATNSLGGFLYSEDLSDTLRHAVQPMAKFRQFANVKDAVAQGKKHGDTFYWDVILNVATQGGTLTETSTIPETNFTIIQGTGTVTEYGNSVPYTGKLTAMSKFDVDKIVRKSLGNDAAKALDTAAHSEFDSTLLVVVGTASGGNVWTSNGTATATNNSALYRANVTNIIDTMKERNIPPYAGDDYVCIAHPSTLRQLKSDFDDVFKYAGRGITKILSGELGRADSCRFVEQTSIAKETSEWDGNSKSNWAFFFGDDAVIEGICIPEEIRAKIPTDYGRSQGVAWYALLGYKIVHADTNQPAQARIVRWDSVT